MSVRQSIVERSRGRPHMGGVGNPVCRRSRLRSWTRFLRRAANASAPCRSEVSWRRS